jgi:predicted NBD/HSP70 family sugar kinase
MYLGVDIGGTKTLVAVLSDSGVIKEKIKFPTPKNYENFLLELRHAAAKLEHSDFKAACIGAPGRLNRKHGQVIRMGNLAWKDVPLQTDAHRFLNCPVIIENDANLAGLSEAQLHPTIETVLYLTISTGIGTGFVHNRQLEPSMLDMEGGHILLEHKGKLVKWESFASGKAIYRHFDKKVADIAANDKAAWKYIVRNLVPGLLTNLAITQPDLVIIGGGVGTYFDRYADLLKAEMQKHLLPVVNMPKIVQAQRPEEAVIYGCYDLAKQVYGHANADN